MKNKEKLTILIVEDDDQTRETVISMLSYDFKNIYSAQDGSIGLELYKKYKPDIIFSDIDMPNLNGLDMLGEIRKFDQKTPIIFLSAHNEISFFQEAIDHKVSGYIVKPVVYNELLKKIELNIDFNEDSGPELILSSREYEIFIEIAKGLKPSFIAEKYGIKPKTVATYRNRILEKLNLQNNSDITQAAIEYKLI